MADLSVTVGKIIPASVVKKGPFTEFEIHASIEYGGSKTRYWIKGPIPHHQGRDVFIQSITDRHCNELVVDIKVLVPRKTKADNLLDTIKMNTFNPKLSDRAFREFIKNTLVDHMA